MTQIQVQQVQSEGLKDALEGARPAFLGRKLSIDDVSNEIRALETELNSMGAKDDFVFPLERVAVMSVSRQIEDYDCNAPLLERQLYWKRHGGSWRLFFRVAWWGWDIFSYGAIDACSSREAEALESFLAATGPSGGRSTYDLPSETELICKPLIDTSTDVRLAVHPRLAEFVGELAKDWTANGYRRDQVVPVSQ